MTATAQLTEVTFSEKRKGYDPGEVDTFLEKVGEKVYELQERLREMSARVEQAEKRAVQAEGRAKNLTAEAGASAEATETARELEETLKNTLLLAQRTADNAVKEATEQAEKIIADSQARSESLTRETATTCRAKAAEADAEVRRRIEAATGSIKGELGVLEDRKRQLSREVDRLERQVSAQRARIEELVTDLNQVLSSTALSGKALEASEPEPPPTVAVAVKPEPAVAKADPVAAKPEPVVAKADSAPAEMVRATAKPQPVVAEDDPGVLPLRAELERAPSVRRPIQPVSRPSAPPRPSADLSADSPDPLPDSPSSAPPAFKPRPDDGDGGPPTARVDAVVAPEPTPTAPRPIDDTSFLDELRRAVNDDSETAAEPSASQLEAMQAFFEQGDSEPKKGRFRRR